jgi:hypothetical protein
MSFASPERKREYMREYYQANKPRLRAKEKAYLRLYRKKLKDQIHAALGSKCNACGFSDARAMQIDHINGGGRMERARMDTKSYLVHLNRLLVNDPQTFFARYQLLCANCNWIKRLQESPEGTTK